VFQQIKLSARRLSSRIKAIWRSVLSWMHWHLTRRMRARKQLLIHLKLNQVQMLEQQQAMLLMLQEVLLQQLTKEDLLEALRPVAAAMLRQDNLHNQCQAETRELLSEVLNSLQPEVQAQIFPRIGQHLQTNSSRSSVS
jgi:hypothetical protein